MNDNEKLTIVTVAGPGDEEYLKRNIENIIENNHGSKFIIHVLDNGCFHGYQRLSYQFDNVLVHDGEPPDHSKPMACRGSYQHASSLNKFIKNCVIGTRYLLIIDPDFYIIRKNWISDVLMHITTSKLSFFGAPWHPKWYSKYRYFPCVHCMFIDTKYVNIEELDFTPDLIERGSKADKKNGITLSGGSDYSAPGGGMIVPRKWFPVFVEIMRDSLITMSNAFSEISQPIPVSLKITKQFVCLLYRIKNRIRRYGSYVKSATINRKIIGSANDTGYLIEKKYSNNTKHETIKPSVTYESDFIKPQYLATNFGKKIEELLPNNISYMPNKSDYITTETFATYGYPDLTNIGWEQFFWKNQPFGVHMRRYNKVNRNSSDELYILNMVLCHSADIHKFCN